MLLNALVRNGNFFSNKTFTLTVLAAVIGLFLFGNIEPLPAAGVEQTVRVTFVLGKVYLHKGRKKTRLRNKTVLKPGAKITTGRRSRVHFQYGSNHEVRVGSNAEVKVNSNKMPRANLLMVVYGKIKVNSRGKKGSGPNFKVVSPTSVCAVRGTEFELGVARDGSSSTKLDKGQISMSSGDKSVDLNRKGNATSRLGESPSKQRYQKRGVERMITRQDRAMKKNPGKVADGYNKQNRYFKDRSKKNASEGSIVSTSVNNLDSKTASKQDMEKVQAKAQKVENRTEDDYYRNEVQTDALSRVLQSYAKGKSDIYARFEQVKRESNKVAEVQQQNLENIRKVREMFEKKRAEIMEKYQKQRDEIWKNLDKNKNRIKPSFDFNKKE